MTTATKSATKSTTKSTQTTTQFTTHHSNSDPSSLSNPDQFVPTHLHWEAQIDFDREVIVGVATYTVQPVKPVKPVAESANSGTGSSGGGGTSDNSGTSGGGDALEALEVKLDTSHLLIHSVKVNDVIASHTLDDVISNKPHLGQCLHIPLPPPTPSTSSTPPSTTTSPTTTSTSSSPTKLTPTYQISIHYETTPQCTATQWLPPAQTASKIHPYMFTQCQAIHARSLIPCWDCPGVKVAYDARVTVPSWATCIMSALSTSNDPTYKPTLPDPESKSISTFSFHQPIPIPAYLLALCTAHLSSRDISARCRIWSEPATIDASTYEFAQVEEFLQIAEKLVGMEYAWGRYDLLCLPPSFPYGGMENPCLTFVTPTLLAGDRSLADVVAHEIMHSWSGNLVTNSTWEHFWLNEGWTRYLQRKVMKVIKKDDRYFDLDALGGWKDLLDSMEEMPGEYTKLCPMLGDNDPDDAFSRVPYEKGFCLLFELENLVGEKRFEEFTKAYFETFKFGTITSEEFKEFFEEYFKEDDKAQSFDWETWLHGEGMPANKPDYDRSLAEESEKLALDWIGLDEGKQSEVPSKDISHWSTLQTTCFLDQLLTHCASNGKSLKVETVHAIKSTYGFDSSHNAEILFRVCRLAISSEDETIFPVVLRFITTQGRMKYIRPLFRALFNSAMGRDIALATFLEHKDVYHPIAAKMVATDLNVSMHASGVLAKGNQDGQKSAQKSTALKALLAVSVAVAVVFTVKARRR